MLKHLSTSDFSNRRTMNTDKVTIINNKKQKGKTRTKTHNYEFIE